MSAEKDEGVLDLDALAAEPLRVKVGGKDYVIAVDVAAMIAIDRARREGSGDDQWTLAERIMVEAGMDIEAFRKLTPKQAIALNDAIIGHFFPEGLAETGTEAPSSGPTPSSPSSDMSAATRQG